MKSWGMFRAGSVALVASAAIMLSGCGSPSGTNANNSTPSASTQTANVAVVKNIPKFSGAALRIAPNQTTPTLPNGFKVPIYWSTALGINVIHFNSREYLAVDGWKGTLQNQPFEIVLYRESRRPPYASSKPYILGFSYAGEPVGGISVMYPVRWLRFTGNDVVIAARYGTKEVGMQTKYYVINIKTGKVNSNQTAAKKMADIGNPDQVTKIQGPSANYDPKVPGANYAMVQTNK
ncbi:MAG: hypothetical protein ACYCYO_20170 [Bacilli bacterium]